MTTEPLEACLGRCYVDPRTGVSGLARAVMVADDGSRLVRLASETSQGEPWEVWVSRHELEELAGEMEAAR